MENYLCNLEIFKLMESIIEELKGLTVKQDSQPSYEDTKLMEKFSRWLDSEVYHAKEGVHILKYGILPCNVRQMLFNYVAKDSMNSIVYIPVDQETLDLYFDNRGEDETDFYRKIIDSVVNLEENSAKIGADNDKLKRLKELYHSNFSAIYDGSRTIGSGSKLS